MLAIDFESCQLNFTSGITVENQPGNNSLFHQIDTQTETEKRRKRGEEKQESRGEGRKGIGVFQEKFSVKT